MKSLNQGIFKVVHIADIHFGAIDPKTLYNELKEGFIKYLYKNKEDIDIIVIHGDYFDRKIQLTEKTSAIALLFMNSLCSFCKKNNIQLRIIKGTKTHDFNQLDNFKHLEKLYSMFKIINTVNVETFHKEDNQLKVLYVPEEYVNDQHAYYAEFMNDTYDVMWGHGTWDVFAYQNQIQESERNIKGYPVFYYCDWENLIKYNIIFGHIHTRNDYKKLSYCGSYTRWIFSEEKDKGFLVSTIDTKNENVKLTFVKNSLAKKYDTVNLKDIMSNEDLNDIKKVSNILEKFKNNENLNIRINISKNEISDENLKILRESVKTSNIKIECKNFMDDDKKESEITFTNDVDLNIKEYIKYKTGQEVPIEIIKKITLEEK